jgi:23S rRNA G2445 N2-methylase RlmL
MAYRMTEREDHRDLASGSVLRSAPGYPAFPVRLAQELFLRAATHLPNAPLTLWDPFCGSGYLATVLGLLHRQQLRRVIATDIEPEALSLATRNLALLTRSGLAARADELRARQSDFHRPSYGEAAEAAARLSAKLNADGGDLTAYVGTADVFDPASLTAVIATAVPDVVVTDLPYGTQTTWSGPNVPPTDPTHQLLRTLSDVLPGHAVLAMTTRARKFPLPPGVHALERFRVGTRSAFVGTVDQLRAHW